MQKVTYAGKSTIGVDLVLPDGTEVHVAHGETVEVADDVASNLLAQGWKPAKTKAPKADDTEEND